MNFAYKTAASIGAKGEYRVASELLGLGYLVCWPSYDSPGFDLLCWNPQTRKATRIQVKTSSQPARSGGVSHRDSLISPAIRFHTESRRSSKNKTRQAYTSEDTDFIVLCYLPLDLYYVIPINDLNGKVSVSAYPNDPRCKLAKYKNAWKLIK